MRMLYNQKKKWKKEKKKRVRRKTGIPELKKLVWKA
jgi:hypothetical protein